MVFFFDVGDDTATGRAGFTVYMGKDSAENDALIEYGWRSDVWFHVDSLSSAHVYLRLPVETALCGCEHRCGCLLEAVPEEIVEEMCQLVKANSISGVKMASVSVVYTPHSNLRKEANMKEGAVSFHSAAHLRLKLVEKDRELVKRLEKTRREAFPDLHQERLEFNRRCVGILKVRRQAAAEAAAAADPRKQKLDKAREREDFLASGGYHSGAIAAQKEAQARAEALWNDEGIEGDEADTLVIGGDGDGAIEREPEAAQDADANPEPEQPQRTYAEEVQLRQQESDPDIRWLRERGYEDEKARSALQLQASIAPVFQRRIAALSSLQPREMSEDVDTDANAASEGRAEEREALESILGEGVIVHIDAGDGESEHIALPIQGFEPPDGAPALVVEVYIDEIAACGYPLGNALPLLAVVGGGLLEEELRTLTKGLLAHAQENIEVGPIAFDLTSYAQEQATELVEQREQRESALAQRRVAARGRAESKADPSKATAATATPNAAAKTTAASDAARQARRIDAQSRLGKFADGKVASTFVTVNEVPTDAADLLGGGAIDKGGYKSKKKKK